MAYLPKRARVRSVSAAGPSASHAPASRFGRRFHAAARPARINVPLRLRYGQAGALLVASRDWGTVSVGQGGGALIIARMHLSAVGVGSQRWMCADRRWRLHLPKVAYGLGGEGAAILTSSTPVRVLAGTVNVRKATTQPWFQQCPFHLRLTSSLSHRMRGQGFLGMASNQAEQRLTASARQSASREGVSGDVLSAFHEMSGSKRGVSL